MEKPMDRVHGGVQRPCGRVHGGPRVIGGRRVGAMGLRSSLKRAGEEEGDEAKP
jgi:hypothetical protein